MLLFDSFLEDELLTTVMKRDVFIAIRRDGQIGSGTRENPYDECSGARVTISPVHMGDMLLRF
jgi:hypothetical protein